MTELNATNRESYLSLCRSVWNLSDESMKYLENRTSDEWKPVEDFNQIIHSPKASSYEDQRVRFDMDMSVPSVQNMFKDNDQSYKLFMNTFEHVISRLAEDYSCRISYADFIANKIVFKKNTTKIKKVFEMVYADYNRDFERDFDCSYTKERCADMIVKAFERIGASKKSSKKLQFVISFNPIDWIMASTAENWSSCFNIANSSGGYQYCLGLPFLSGDKNRFLAYITDGSQKESMGIKVDHFYTRTWVILNEDGKYAITKWYPNDTMGIKPAIELSGIGNFCSREDFSRGKYPIDVISTKGGAVIGVYLDMGELKNIGGKLYLDGNEKTGQQIFTKNLIKIDDSSNTSYTSNLRIPSNGLTRSLDINSWYLPKWKKYGLNVDMCFQHFTCTCCGKNAPAFLVNDKIICDDCYSSMYFTCTKCGKKKERDEKHTVASNMGEVEICDSCFSSMKSSTCNYCNKYIIKDAVYPVEDGNRLCQSCLDIGKDGYAKCSCGTVSKNVMVAYNSFSNTAELFCDNDEKPTASYLTFGRKYNIVVKKYVRGLSE